ncbi:MAG: hypothetical protein RLZZ387_1629 [Chloroflexota bacterium]
MKDWHSADVRANGVTLRYYRSGGEGPQLVLAHGMTDAAGCWSPVAEELARDYDVVAYDARGHGRSEKTSGGYVVPVYAADLAALVVALGLSRPLLLGHSMGAATAAWAAAEHPGLFRAALLEDPPWRAADAPRSDPEWTSRWHQDILAMQRMPRDELLRKGRAEHPTWPEDQDAPWADAKTQVNPDIFETADGILIDWQAVVPRIACPLLLITGDPELGGIVTPDVSREVQSLLPGAQVAHIAGAGHSVRRDRRDSYLAAVHAFLAAHR